MNRRFEVIQVVKIHSTNKAREEREKKEKRRRKEEKKERNLSEIPEFFQSNMSMSNENSETRKLTSESSIFAPPLSTHVLGDFI